MSRIRWSMKSQKGAVHVDVPSGLNGNPVVLTGRIADGSSYGPEYLDAAERRTCLDRAAALATLLIMSALLGCGGAGSAQSTGVGGAGGSSSVTTGTMSSSGTGGAAPADEEIGEGACNAAETAIGPLNGEASDAMGQPIHEDGATAMLRVTPPAYPWTATALTYGLSATGICAYTDHEVVAFAGPEGSPPQHPAGASVTTVLANTIVDDGGGATVTESLTSPVTVQAGEVLWIGVRLHIKTADARTCVYACDDVAPPGDPASWYSATNAAAKVDLCPEASCDLEMLGTSPDPVTAKAYHNNIRRWPFVVTGHR